jgi:hypothetical protein
LLESETCPKTYRPPAHPSTLPVGGMLDAWDPRPNWAKAGDAKNITAAATKINEIKPRTIFIPPFLTVECFVMA